MKNQPPGLVTRWVSVRLTLEELRGLERVQQATLLSRSCVMRRALASAFPTYFPKPLRRRGEQP